MLNFRLLATLLTLLGIVYGIIQVKSFLNENFVENDTRIKKQMNDFLNGKQKIPQASRKIIPTENPIENPRERIIEIDQKQLDQAIQDSEEQ